MFGFETHMAEKNNHRTVYQKKISRMNMQKRSDERSKALHRAVAKKLRHHPELWSVPQNNIKRWKKRRNTFISAIVEWEQILDQRSKEEILAILEGDSEESARLRSSSPFTGILSDTERKRIFDIYRSGNSRNSRDITNEARMKTVHTNRDV